MDKNYPPYCLSIAGSDPSGGAGIQADLKVFQKQNCFGCSISTLETVQNSKGVKEIHINKPEVVLNQLNALNFNFSAIKLGALGNKEIIKSILNSKILENNKIILDPIIKSSNSVELFKNSDIEFLKSELLPKTFLITPNIPEAELLCGIEINSLDDIKKAAKKIKTESAAKNVLIKGGHLEGEDCIDILYANKRFIEFSNKKIPNKNVHGTGCFLSSNITALIAKGETLEKAVKQAIEITNISIQNSNSGLLSFF